MTVFTSDQPFTMNQLILKSMKCLSIFQKARDNILKSADKIQNMFTSQKNRQSGKRECFASLLEK